MSTAKRGGGAKKKSSDESKTVDDPRSDDISGNGDKMSSRGEEVTPPKPPSAGFTTREGANKLLNLALKGEWQGVEAVVKQLEKAVANANDDAKQPLANVLDFVSTFFLNECVLILTNTHTYKHS